jgi:hypothetical protein
VVVAVHFTIEHCQMFTHHHAIWAKEVVEAYRQDHGFNDENH